MRDALLAVVLVGVALPVHAASWCSNGDGEFVFETTFEGAELPGRFRKFSVQLDFDPATPGEGRLRVAVDLGAADMGDPEMNAVLLDPAWFHVERFAEAVYQSDDLVPASSPGNFVANGTLSLKGTDKTVSVPFSWATVGEEATMRGQTVLRRTDFDVGSGEWASGDAIGIEVSLNFAIQLARCE